MIRDAPLRHFGLFVDTIAKASRSEHWRRVRSRRFSRRLGIEYVASLSSCTHTHTPTATVVCVCLRKHRAVIIHLPLGVLTRVYRARVSLVTCVRVSVVNSAAYFILLSGPFCCRRCHVATLRVDSADHVINPDGVDTTRSLDHVRVSVRDVIRHISFMSNTTGSIRPGQNMLNDIANRHT